MKKYIRGLLFLFFALLQTTVVLRAQDIVNLVLVGDEGITEDIKKANSFIVIKKYPDEVYQRLDYTLGGPLKQLRTYSDSTLTKLEGENLLYNADGRLYIYGNYEANQKAGEWRYLNDTGGVVKTERYEKGVLIDPDFKRPPGDTSTYGDEKEASFKKGMKDWIAYIQKNLDPDAGSKSVKGGKVLVRFIVNKMGKTTGINLEKSVEFVLDEAAIKVIRDSPLWQPAFQHGKTVNAYRRQPLTFIKE